MMSDSGMTLPRFYPILDTAAVERAGCSLIEAAEALLDAGARVLQLRHKDHYSRALFAQAETLSSMCRDAGAQFMINDRGDIAMLLEGAGVHVGQDDLPPALARRVIGASRVLGFSTHNENQLRAALAEPADYLAIGPIFATGSKQNPDPVVGLDELRRLRPLLDRPLVAIGGITLDNAPAVYAAGADSIAVISAVCPPSATKAVIRQCALEWLQL